MKNPRHFENPSCSGTDTEAFFPDTTGVSVETKMAMQICKTCPCLQDCLTYALHYRVSGIWGGTNGIQRKRLRKQLNISAKEIISERLIS